MRPHSLQSTLFIDKLIQSLSDYYHFVFLLYFLECPHSLHRERQHMRRPKHNIINGPIERPELLEEADPTRTSTAGAEYSGHAISAIHGDGSFRHVSAAGADQRLVLR